MDENRRGIPRARRDESVHLATCDRSCGAAIGRIEVNGNGGNGAAFRTFDSSGNRWPSMMCPRVDTGLAVFSARRAEGASPPSERRKEEREDRKKNSGRGKKVGKKCGRRRNRLVGIERSFAQDTGRRWGTTGGGKVSDTEKERWRGV